MKRGFSLLELIIALGLIGIVMTAINVLLFSTLRTAKKAEAVGQSKSEGALAMQGMTQMMRFAHAVDPATCNTDQIRIYRYVKDATGVTRDHDILYSLTGNQIASTSSYVVIPPSNPPQTNPGNQVQTRLTSPQVRISRCTGWGSVFTCTPSGAGVQVRSIGICYVVNTTTTLDSAIDNGRVQFETQVTMRNVDN